MRTLGGITSQQKEWMWGKPSVEMEPPTRKDTTLEFLLQLLKEEREKRREVESELVILKTILEAQQQKKMNQYRINREASIQNIRENYYRKQHHEHGKISCDGERGDAETGVDLDLIDSLIGVC